MTVFKFSAKILFSVSVFLVASSAFAGFWEWSTPYQGPHKDIITLVITANYAKPRIVAQLIQNENRQPFILLPKKGGDKIFFWPAGKKNLALEIREKKLARFIKFLNPSQVIVLGDKRYVSQKYLDTIDKNITTVIIQNDNWEKSAMTLQKMLKLNNLYRDFKRLNDEAKGGLYKPTPRRQPIAQDEVSKQDKEVVTITVDDDATEVDPAASSKTPAAEAEVKVEVKEPGIKAPKSGPVLIEE
ncbi:MAG: hypothetical protein L3J71_09505 [Victivallaceae bacterium]|nr:hypothetical protein [Victivallaceae bacterium]